MTETQSTGTGTETQTQTPQERIAELEQRLATIKRRFEYMVEGAPDGLLVIYKQRKSVLQINPAFARMVGDESGIIDYSLKNDSAELPSLAKYVDERHWPAIDAALDRQLRRKDGELVFRVDVVHQVTQERIPTEWTFHQPSRSRAAAIFVRDLRERLRSQRQIEDYSRTLEERNRELRETQAQLVHQGKMAALGELVAGVAHDINTPLGSIKSSAEVAAKLCSKLGSANGSPAQLKKMLAMLSDANGNIATASERIDGIIRSLRSFARLDESELKSVDLREGIQTALELTRPLHEGRVRVDARLAEIPKVTCRAGELNQVFLNLISNAIQAIDGEGAVTVRSDVRDGEVLVSIADTGRGISPEHRVRLFDPGFTTKGVGVGTGLGLSIASRIVSEHGGRIDVESEPGVGSTFTVRLPIEGDASAPSLRKPVERRPDMRLVDTPTGISAALLAAHETGLIGKLAEGPGDANEIAEALGLDARATRRVLEVLLTAGYADWADGRYVPNPTTELIHQTRGVNVRIVELWEHTPHFLRTGECVQLPRGSGASEREESYASAVAMLNKLFRWPALDLARRLSFPPGAHILDVGCGSGVWSLTMLETHEGVVGTGLDFPKVLENYSSEAAKRGVADRVKTLPGNMHEAQLPEGAFDMITLANVVHLEPEERLEPLFSRLLPALKPDGELVIIDAIHEDPSCAASRAVYALHLSMRVAEGVVHAPARLQQALSRAGFGRTSVVELTPESGALGALRASR